GGVSADFALGFRHDRSRVISLARLNGLKHIWRRVAGTDFPMPPDRPDDDGQESNPDITRERVVRMEQSDGRRRRDGEAGRYIGRPALEAFSEHREGDAA